MCSKIYFSILIMRSHLVFPKFACRLIVKERGGGGGGGTKNQQLHNLCVCIIFSWTLKIN